MKINRRNIIHLILLLMCNMGIYWFAIHYGNHSFTHETISAGNSIVLSSYCGEQEQSEEEKIHTPITGISPVERRYESPSPQRLEHYQPFLSHWQPPKIV